MNYKEKLESFLKGEKINLEEKFTESLSTEKNNFNRIVEKCLDFNNPIEMARVFY